MKTENLVISSQPKHYSTLKSRKQRSMSTLNLVNNSVVNKSVNNATAGINPSGRLSFKRAPIVVPVAKTFGEKMALNKTFNWFLDKLADNTLVAEAIIALGLTGVFRPLSIYAIPTKDPIEKKKNNYQVGQSIATGLLGLGTTLLVSEPIKKGVQAIIKNPEKYIMPNDQSLAKMSQNKQEVVKKAAEQTIGVIKKYDKVFKEVTNRIHQPIFLPLRAMLTIAIIKPILNALGLVKPSKNEQNVASAKVDYSFMSFKGDEPKTFKNIARIDSNKSSNNPSFKGANAVVTEGLAKGISKIVKTKPYTNFINWFGKNYAENDAFFPHVIATESLWLSGFYMYNTGKSKKIEKDQKLAMILNQGITAIGCAVGAYKLDGVIKKKLANYRDTTYSKMHPIEVDLKKRYSALLEKYKDNPAQLERIEKSAFTENARKATKKLDSRFFGLRMLGPIVIFTTIYRFIGPVFVTPVANWLSEKIQPHKKAA